MAKKTDLSKMSLEELNAHAKDVAKAIKDFEERKRKEALAAVQAVAKDHGFNLNEIIGTGPMKGKAKAKNPAKYAHPENPELTWSGRGRQPKWVKEALAGGKTLKDFAI